MAAPPEQISNINNAIVEYKGIFIGHSSHGLTRSVDSIYIRTPSHVMNEISELSRNDTPRSIYNRLIANKGQDFPINNLKQIRNKKYNQTRKELEPTHISNLADQFQYINELATKETMIRAVNLEPNYGIVIFNDYQLLNIEKFCCSGMTPLEFDKTIN